MRLINIDKTSSFPKYKQIVFSIEVAIAEKRLKREDKLPSVNKVSLEFSISRDTVLLAYDELKKRGNHISDHYKNYSQEFKESQIKILLNKALPKASEWHGSPEGWNNASRAISCQPGKACGW